MKKRANSLFPDTEFLSQLFSVRTVFGPRVEDKGKRFISFIISPHFLLLDSKPPPFLAATASSFECQNVEG